MKAWVDELLNEKTELQIAPLIDVVFLLLIYFMVSSSLKRSEADLSLSLPSIMPQAQAMEIPDEQVIDILADGRIVMNDRVYSDPEKKDLDDLEQTLIRFREFSTVIGSSSMITIFSDEDARHERVIDVLNACAGAEIKQVTFGSGE